MQANFNLEGESLRSGGELQLQQQLGARWLFDLQLGYTDVLLRERETQLPLTHPQLHLQ